MSENQYAESIQSFESFIGEAKKHKDKDFIKADFFLKEDDNSYIDIYIFLKIKKDVPPDEKKDELNKLISSIQKGDKLSSLHKLAINVRGEFKLLSNDDFKESYRSHILSKIEEEIKKRLGVFKGTSTIENKVIDNIKRDITKEFNYNDDDVLFTKNQIQEYLDETIKKLLNDSGIKINTDINTNNYKSNNNQSGNNTNYTKSNTSKKFAILIGLIIIVSLVIYFKKRGITHSNKKIIKPVSNKSINIAKNNNNLKPINRINHGNIYQPNIVRKSQNIVKENKTTASDVVSTKSSVPYKKTVRLSNSQKPSPKVAYVPNISSKIFQEQGFQLFKMSGCLYCHRIYNKGYKNGSNLSNIGSSMSLAEIENQIIRPANSSMPPNANMPSNEVAQIANWLESLK